MEPSDDELRRAVEAATAGREEELESDVTALTRLLTDDHFMWKLSQQRVQSVVDAIRAARVPPREVPQELFAMDWEDAIAADALTPRAWAPGAFEGVHHAQGGLGSLGCFLIKLRGDGFVVLKQRTQALPSESFAGELLRALGVRAPAFRPLPDAELDQLIWALRETPVSVPGTCGEIHGPRFRAAGAVLMEFACGHHLEDVPLVDVVEDLSPADWHALGALAAADVALNNPDRFPTVWRSEEGNPENLLVDPAAPPGERVVAIDSAANVIAPGALRDAYMARAARLGDAASADRMLRFLALDEHEDDLPPNTASDGLRALWRGAHDAVATMRGGGGRVVREAARRAAAQFPELDADAAAEFVVQAAQHMRGSDVGGGGDVAGAMADAEPGALESARGCLRLIISLATGSTA